MADYPVVEISAGRVRGVVAPDTRPTMVFGDNCRVVDSPWPDTLALWNDLDVALM